MAPRGPVPNLLRATSLRPGPRSRPYAHRDFSLPSFNIPGLPPSAPQTIQARRILPYPAPQVYTLIADVDSYASFLPFCTSSRVTRWTGPDGSGRRWPTQADLTVGWGPLSESYTSRLYCVPDEVVEAVSGHADTTIPEATLRKYGLQPQGGREGIEEGKGAPGAVGVFDSLVTRWALHPAPARTPEAGTNDKSTEVTLSIRFRFTNPAYGLAVGQAADEMVSLMIEAFEKRAKQMYDGQRAPSV